MKTFKQLTESFFPTNTAYFTYVSVWDEILHPSLEVTYIYNIRTKTQVQLIELRNKLTGLGWKFSKPTQTSQKFTKSGFYYKVGSVNDNIRDIRELSPL